MKIICIGQNYAEHIKELKSAFPEKPVYFLKPDTCLIRNNQPFYLPDFSNDLHHEVEIVIKINRLGKNIEERFAHRYYDELTVGIDFTARDLQREAKSKGLPWEIAKAFDGSAPIGKFISIDTIRTINDLNFELNINDSIVQKGNTSDMIFKVDKIISYVSQFMTLKIGDLIYTGTPSGVGPVKIGDKLTASIEGNILLEFYVK